MEVKIKYNQQSLCRHKFLLCYKLHRLQCAVIHLKLSVRRLEHLHLMNLQAHPELYPNQFGTHWKSFGL